ncbi:MAG: hypothetical protein AB1391_02980 [Candidatus Micrarchaeota archaeon]
MIFARTYISNISKRTLSGGTGMLAVFLALFLVFIGCLGTPKPLNETDFFQAQNYSTQKQPAVSSDYAAQSSYNAAKNFQNGQNIGLKCNLSNAGSMGNFNFTIHIIIYIKGNNTRSEYFDLGSNNTYITITKGEDYYIKENNYRTESKNCSWVHFTKKAFNKSKSDMQNILYGNLYGNQNQTQTQNYNDINNTNNIMLNNINSMNINNIMSKIPKCVLINLNDEIFETNGTICKAE